MLSLRRIGGRGVGECAAGRGQEFWTLKEDVMAEYIKQEMNDLRGEGVRRAYYRMRVFDNFDTERLLDYMCRDGGGVSRGDVVNVVERLSKAVADLVALGHSVTVGGLGTFRASLGVAEGAGTGAAEGAEPRRNAATIEVRDVLFRADRRLVRAVNGRVRLVPGGVSRVRRPATTVAERLAAALALLDERGVMSVADYAALTGLGRTAAARELRALRADPASGLGVRGRGSHKLYVRAAPGG